jgi:hypothetical protein
MKIAIPADSQRMESDNSSIFGIMGVIVEVLTDSDACFSFLIHFMLNWMVT